MSEHKEILAQFLRKLTEFVACFNGPMKLFLMMWSFSQKAKQSNHHHPLPQRTFSPSRVIGNGVLLLNNGGVSEMSWRRLFPQWRNPESGSLVWVKIDQYNKRQQGNKEARTHSKEMILCENVEHQNWLKSRSNSHSVLTMQTRKETEKLKNNNTVMKKRKGNRPIWFMDNSLHSLKVWLSPYVIWAITEDRKIGIFPSQFY